MLEVFQEGKGKNLQGLRSHNVSLLFYSPNKSTYKDKPDSKGGKMDKVFKIGRAEKYLWTYLIQHIQTKERRQEVE
jgi:hypothetical protein